MASSNPRRVYAGKRDRLRKSVAAKGMPCALCGKPIDYALPAGHPMSFELDEMIPVSRWREGPWSSAAACATDPGNVQPAHRICNQRKGNGLNRKPVYRAKLNPPEWAE